MKKSDAISHFGSSSELAKKLGISKQSVSQWGDEVPRGRAFELEHLTNGELKADLNHYQQPESK